MMLKSMLATGPENKLTGGGRAEETFGSMLDQEYATAAARRGGIGIASMVEKELLRRYEGTPQAAQIRSVGEDNE
jgi:flagellar protein FlgJ